MSAIEVGMYVRYQGKISKIVDIDTKTFSTPAFKLDTFSDGMYQSLECLENCKKSFNIKDLLEEGDYINGSKLIRKNKTLGYYANNLEKIKSIVTKEQFKEIEYRIEE